LAVVELASLEVFTSWHAVGLVGKPAPWDAPEAFFPRALIQPKVPWPISMAEQPSRSRTRSLTAAPALAMSQAFREASTAYLAAGLRDFLGMNALQY